MYIINSSRSSFKSHGDQSVILCLKKNMNEIGGNSFNMIILEYHKWHNHALPPAPSVWQILTLKKALGTRDTGVN